MKKLQAVEIPLTPNFIKVGSTYESIAKFSDQELKDIGKRMDRKAD